jgi:peroxiredoxin
MRRVSVAVITAALMLLTILISACSINESAVDALGALEISALDTSQTIWLESAQVLVNGIPRGTELPLVVDGIPAGEVEITLRPGLAYPPKTLTATVDPPETTMVVFQYSATEVIATVTVQSDQADAIIVINEQFQNNLTVGETFNLPAGVHTISLFKEGYITEAPSMYNQDFGGEAYTLDFTLTEAAYGNVSGELFPDFTMMDSDGNDQTLGQYRGQVVLVNFWFTSCIPCREEFPTIEQVFQERGAEGFRVLGVNTGQTFDDITKIRDFRESFGLNFPLLVMDQVNYGYDWVFGDLALLGAPTNFILSPDGVIYSRQGVLSYDLLNDLIDDALGGE